MTVSEAAVDMIVADTIAKRCNGDTAVFEASLAKQGYSIDQFRRVEREKLETHTARRIVLEELGASDQPRKEQDDLLRQWVAQRRQEVSITFPRNSK